MTKKKLRGRPKLPKNETRKLLSVRVSKVERENLTAAAKAQGLKISQWARNELLAAAARDIRHT